MKFKFLYQDADLVSLADKGIVVRCFVCRSYDKVLMETGKLCGRIKKDQKRIIKKNHKFDFGMETHHYNTSSFIHWPPLSCITFVPVSHRFEEEVL